MKKIRVFEAFAGYGGATLGLRRSGLDFEVVGMSEFDKYANHLLAVNYPDVKNYGDITKIDYASLPDFDLFTGGFPCQPFSNAGLQMGENDKYGRGTLLYDILKLVECKKPKYILLENVKGFTAKKFQGTFDYLKNTLKRLGYGDLSYAVLNTKDYGIPQNRERLWMFAQLGGGKLT